MVPSGTILCATSAERDLVLLVSDFTIPTTFALIPQRRGSLKNLTEGSHLFECSLSFILLISKFYPPTTFALIPQRRGSLKNLFEWVPLVEWLSLPCLICFQNFTPLRHKLFDVLLCGCGLGVVWVGCGVGRIYL